MSFEKRKIALRYWLIGKGFFEALDAMEFAEKIHSGTRKDGVTPEFNHQVGIAHVLRSLPDLMYPEETITTGFLHDVCEDGGIEPEYITNRWGARVGTSVWAMTKKFRGIMRPEAQVLDEMAEDAIASIGKGVDRGDNMGSMTGVFTPTKQLDYVDYAEKKIIPMLKKARRKFPKQERAYEIVKHGLHSQIELVKAIHQNIA